MGILEKLLEALPVQALADKLLDLIFKKEKKQPPTDIVTKPVGGDPADDFPDDFIPSVGTGGRRVVKVVLKLNRVQLNKKRFPEAYQNGQNGLLDNPRQYEDGPAISYASKIWLDLTATDESGREWLREDIINARIAFKTEHHCGGSFIKGRGMDVNGDPLPGYETNEANGVGNGITAWLSSKGFLHQMKVNQEGVFECYGVVDGVESNHFTLTVS